MLKNLRARTFADLSVEVECPNRSTHLADGRRSATALLPRSSPSAAEAASRAGARLAFTYQNHAMARRVVPLAESVGAEITVPCDVADGDEIDAAFDSIADS